MKRARFTVEAIKFFGTELPVERFVRAYLWDSRHPGIGNHSEGVRGVSVRS